MPTTAKQLIDAANAAVPKISGQEAQEMVANGALLVDIRDSAELAQTGKAAGSIHIPRGSMETKVEALIPRDRRIVIYCASGNRSAFAADTLNQMGYENVASMSQGIRGWVDAGGELES